MDILKCHILVEYYINAKRDSSEDYGRIRQVEHRRKYGKMQVIHHIAQSYTVDQVPYGPSQYEGQAGGDGGILFIKLENVIYHYQ